MDKVLILGRGEVGKPILELCEEAGFETYSYDLKDFQEEGKTEPDIKNLDYMHICFPYFSRRDFVSSVVSYIKRYHPRLTIIHSTVGAGTTQEIIRESGQSNVVHSPIRGNHLNMKSDIKSKFVKFVGVDNTSYSKLAYEHLSKVMKSYRIIVFYNSIESELGKLMETTWYGINIAFLQEAQMLCDNYNISFENVITRFSEDGYFDKEHTMKRPYKMYAGIIGGHCVLPNFQILSNEEGFKFSRLSYDMNTKFEEKVKKK